MSDDRSRFTSQPQPNQANQLPSRGRAGHLPGVREHNASSHDESRGASPRRGSSVPRSQEDPPLPLDPADYEDDISSVGESITGVRCAICGVDYAYCAGHFDDDISETSSIPSYISDEWPADLGWTDFEPLPTILEEGEIPIAEEAPVVPHPSHCPQCQAFIGDYPCACGTEGQPIEIED